MFKLCYICICYLVLTLFSRNVCSKIYSNIIFNLATVRSGETITEFRNLTEPQYSIIVTNIAESISFFVIQIHTLSENITLCYNDLTDTHSCTSGTNIGLVWKDDIENKLSLKNSAQFYILRNQNTDEDLKVLLVINTYSQDDPIPGGCNLSFETEIAPYQKINQTDDVIIVTSQPPSTFGEFCNKNNISTEMYYLYLKEHDNSSDEYFAGIQKMLSAENITKYGTKVPDNLAPNKFKQMYNKYIGTGIIFAVVSTNRGSSAYVPAVSYGCNVDSWDEDCFGPVGVHWKVIIAIMAICGLVLCLGGHRYFKTGLFIVGYTFGVIVIQISVTIDDDFTTDGKAIFSLIMGLFFAITWVFLWWWRGVPVLAVELAFLINGFLIASVLFYTQLGNLSIFADDIAFWSSFAIVLLLCHLPILFLRPFFYISALSLLGSYAVIVAMNYYVGGNLPYIIIINTFRRIAVKDFGTAVIDPPFQLLDISQTVLWALIFGIGVFIQYKHSLGKPPFPPNRKVEVANPNERTPLLYPEAPPPYSVS